MLKLRYQYTYKPFAQNLKQYVKLSRLNRPVGIMFLFIPCLWGLALAGDLRLAVYFLIGAILMRSAGCVYNDIVDRHIDCHVERTKQRPLACQAIPVRGAILLMLGLMSASLIILLQFNELTIWLGLASVVLVGCYPWMKRITYWPQLFLGLTFNWGAIMGYAAVTEALNLKLLLIYVYGILWTVFYDTLYAHQDKEDDAIIGVKSTALRLGSKTKPFLSILVVIQSLLLAFLGLYITSIIAALVSLCILAFSNLSNHSSCLEGFRRSQIIGWVVFAGLILQ